MNKFQIRVKGSHESVHDFEKMIVSWGIPSGAKVSNVHRDTPHSKLWCVIVNEVPGRWISQRKDALEKCRNANPNITLSISVPYKDDVFDFADAPLDKLKKFLENPRGWIFPPLDILTDGCKKCFQNALDLVASAENLLKQRKILTHHVEFFLLQAFEEFGKGLLILEEGKDAMKAGKRALAMSSFRSHRKKLDKASKELFGQRIWGKVYRRKEGAFWLIVNHMRRSGNPRRANELSDTIWEMLRRLESPSDEFYLWPILWSLRHPGEHRREQTLYLDYVGDSKSWLGPQTQLSENQLRDFAELLKISCKVMIEEINAKKEIDEVHDIRQVLTSPGLSLPSDC